MVLWLLQVVSQLKKLFMCVFGHVQGLEPKGEVWKRTKKRGTKTIVTPDVSVPAHFHYCITGKLTKCTSRWTVCSMCHPIVSLNLSTSQLFFIFVIQLQKKATLENCWYLAWRKKVEHRILLYQSDNFPDLNIILGPFNLHVLIWRAHIRVKLMFQFPNRQNSNTCPHFLQSPPPPSSFPSFPFQSFKWRGVN